MILMAATVFAACEKQQPSTGKFGDQNVTVEGATPIGEFVATASPDQEKKGKVTGKVVKVCQKKGCWFNLETGTDQYVRIITKDHSFSIPKDASGKTAIAEGTLRSTKVSVDRQKHLAEDAGKSAEEIAKITEEKVEYEFEADGVIIQ